MLGKRVLNFAEFIEHTREMDHLENGVHDVQRLAKSGDEFQTATVDGEKPRGVGSIGDHDCGCGGHFIDDDINDDIDDDINDDTDWVEDSGEIKIRGFVMESAGELGQNIQSLHDSIRKLAKAMKSGGEIPDSAAKHLKRAISHVETATSHILENV